MSAQNKFICSIVGIVFVVQAVAFYGRAQGSPSTRKYEARSQSKESRFGSLTSADDCESYVPAKSCGNPTRQQVVFTVNIEKQNLSVDLISRQPDGSTLRTPVNTKEEIKVSTGRGLLTFSEKLDRRPFCAHTPLSPPRGFYISYDGDSEDPGDTFRNYTSKEFNVPMPYAMRVRGGIFIHGVPSKYNRYLGSPASAGCIRTSVENACHLFATLKTCKGARVVIEGSWDTQKPVYRPHSSGMTETDAKACGRKEIDEAEPLYQARLAKFREQNERDRSREGTSKDGSPLSILKKFLQ